MNFWTRWRGWYLLATSFTAAALNAILIAGDYMDVESNCSQCTNLPFTTDFYLSMFGYSILPCLITWAIFVFRRSTKNMQSYIIALVVPFISPTLVTLASLISSENWSDFGSIILGTIIMTFLFFIPCLVISMINAAFVAILPKDESA